MCRAVHPPQTPAAQSRRIVRRLRNGSVAAAEQNPRRLQLGGVAAVQQDKGVAAVVQGEQTMAPGTKHNTLSLLDRVK